MTASCAPHDHWESHPTLEQLQRADIMQLRADFLEKLFPDVVDMTVLEVGSGPAHDSLIFAERGARVTALDRSQAGLQIAREIYAELALPLQTCSADAMDIPFDEDAFDVAFNGGVLEHFADDELEKVIDEMIRVVRPGGIVLVFCPNRYNVFYQRHLRQLPEHSYEFERAFSADELRQRFEARGLQNVRVSGVHVHPAPNYFLPQWLPKYHRIEPWCRWLFSPLERTWRLHRLKSLISQDFVAWGTVGAQTGDKLSFAKFGGGPTVRAHGLAA